MRNRNQPNARVFFSPAEYHALLSNDRDTPVPDCLHCRKKAVSAHELTCGDAVCLRREYGS